MIYDLQKASILKRFSAFLLDFIIVCILAVGFVALMMVIVGYDAKYTAYEETVDRYSADYGINLRIDPAENAVDAEASAEIKKQAQEAYSALRGEEEILNHVKAYNALVDKYIADYGVNVRKVPAEDASAEEKAKYLETVDMFNADEQVVALNEAFKASVDKQSAKYERINLNYKKAYETVVYKFAYEAFAQDSQANALYVKIMSLTFLSVSIGLFLSVLIAEFVIPLFLKNGQTVGKKVFNIGVMQVTGVRITPFILFVRAVLGKYTIEIMVPILILLMIVMGIGNLLTLIVLLALIVFQIVLLIATKTNSCIHDALSSTVVVDLATQMIFYTKEEMIRYKEELHQTETEKTEYK